jgi:hypothetical protein
MFEHQYSSARVVNPLSNIKIHFRDVLLRQGMTIALLKSAGEGLGDFGPASE